MVAHALEKKTGERSRPTERSRSTLQNTAAGVFRAIHAVVLSRWAGRLDCSRVEWLDKEVFPSPPEGRRRTLDLVGKVPTCEAVRGARPGDPETWLALIHIEIESPDRVAPLRPRMFHVDDSSTLYIDPMGERQIIGQNCKPEQIEQIISAFDVVCHIVEEHNCPTGWLRDCLLELCAKDWRISCFPTCNFDPPGTCAKSFVPNSLRPCAPNPNPINLRFLGLCMDVIHDADCGMASTILHELIHHCGIPGEDVPEACEAKCYGVGGGDASKCCCPPEVPYIDFGGSGRL